MHAVYIYLALHVESILYIEQEDINDNAFLQLIKGVFRQSTLDARSLFRHPQDYSLTVLFSNLYLTREKRANAMEKKKSNFGEST